MVREMHVKTTLKTNFHLLHWQKSKDLKYSLFIGKTVGKTSPLIILLVGMQNSISLFRGGIWQYLASYMFTFDSAIPILGIGPKDTQAKIQNIQYCSLQHYL